MKPIRKLTKKERKSIKRWFQGWTGMPIIDAITKDLIKTGYINYHAR